MVGAADALTIANANKKPVIKMPLMRLVVPMVNMTILRIFLMQKNTVMKVGSLMIKRIYHCFFAATTAF
jgi:hypothetical protein